MLVLLLLRTQFANELVEFHHNTKSYRVKQRLGEGKFGVAFLVCDNKVRSLKICFFGSK